MKKIVPTLVLVMASIGFLGGCVSLNSSSISDVSNASSGQPVKVTVSGDLGILHLVAPKDLTQKANQELLSKCSSGKLTDVQTQLSTRDFLGIVQIYKVRASAVCQ
ncbi:hypothetical protein [Leptospirillum ferriphilum]|jgi:hypothetical protein|uniref:Lipoprotein n=3 Tax=Leptospirillum ferriphilum TaxID=178606 RepID=A0A059XXU6_9BACT|nr:hypothetical protein [Leptospirillum ferriphilum]AFS52673.1 hypothetical protein LFML04_0434 [Leptospirillum ferriphilum ML-04]AIA30052.1 hypothetical protein Y981_02230 [Leptospirillum ferriphilum YSK]OOH72844.1 hypothetical protein BOX24_05500 [Leptospirillum ferriphilum]OOH77306.1 hypothetical protein BOX30_10040 [Leptospirillum ferriphilum]